MKIQIRMPSLRPEMKSGVLCQWNAEPGDTVRSGEVLFEIETDKVVSQVEAAADMKIVELLAEEGDEVAPGTVIATAEVDEKTAEEAK